MRLFVFLAAKPVLAPDLALDLLIKCLGLCVYRDRQVLWAVWLTLFFVRIRDLRCVAVAVLLCGLRCAFPCPLPDPLSLLNHSLPSISILLVCCEVSKSDRALRCGTVCSWAGYSRYVISTDKPVLPGLALGV